MKQRWIVTGANGYLGGEACKVLAHRGAEVHALARAGRSMHELEQLGITCHSYDDLDTILTEGDTVIHCAGRVGNVGAWDDFVRVNVDWTVSLFQQAAERGASCFVYASSVAALGYRNRRSGEMLEEAVPLLCEGELYGRSKWLAEQALRKSAADAKTRLVVLRPGLIYGRRTFATSQTWLRRGFVVDPGQRVPLVHIDSLLDAVFKVVQRSEAEPVTFLVVDEEQPSLHELNAMRIQHGLLRYRPWHVGRTGYWLLSICRYAVRALQGRRATVPKGYARAQYYFATRRLRYSTRKLRSVCGWMPTVTLTEGLKSCCLIRERHSECEEECVPSQA